MGIIFNKDVEEKELYSAYGLTVYGKENRYDSVYSPEVKSCYITLRISDGERNVLDMYLGNRCVFPDVFSRTIDNFLYWIDKDKPDDYDLENAVFKDLCASNSLFNYGIENRKRREQKELEDKKRAEAIKAEEQRKIDAIQKWCEEKEYMFKRTWKSNYVINILNDKVTEMFEIADADRMESLIQFMQEHPDIPDARLVMRGELEDIYNRIC